MANLKNNSWETKINKQLKGAKEASRQMVEWSTSLRNEVLADVAKEIRAQEKIIIRENLKDLKAAKSMGLTSAMIDRLTLTPERIKAMAAGVDVVRKLEDPIGKKLSDWKREDGLKIKKVSVPLGVILIIFESRPNVTVECAALCLKSSNAVLLRGGKEAFYSNKVLVGVFEKVLKKHKLPTSCINFVDVLDHAAVDYLLLQEESLDLVIPRGGERLIRKVAAQSRIPVIKHYQGICHVYIDEKANLKKATEIALNAKLHRPGVCNAMEALLVHEKVAAKLLPQLGSKLIEHGCEVRADKIAKKYITGSKLAKSSDFGFEFLEKILAIKVVKDTHEAIAHINKFGSGHTDAIVTQDKAASKMFLSRVDSSSVMVNASTRFADGFEYGFGAEIGISTDKIHARGPMGLEGLTSYKYLVEGTGHVRK